MSGSAKPLRGVRVLVVEDEAILAFDMMRMLSEAGAEVIGPASSVQRAVELAKKEDVDCGILNIELRDGLVVPAAEVLRQKGVKIVFYTGWFDPEGIRRNWPDAKVLEKPASLPALAQAVIEACAAA
jgi:two-component SAPR family response regulator